MRRVFFPLVRVPAFRKLTPRARPLGPNSNSSPSSPSTTSSNSPPRTLHHPASPSHSRGMSTSSCSPGCSLSSPSGNGLSLFAPCRDARGVADGGVCSGEQVGRGEEVARAREDEARARERGQEGSLGGAREAARGVCNRKSVPPSLLSGAVWGICRLGSRDSRALMRVVFSCFAERAIHPDQDAGRVGRVDHCGGGSCGMYEGCVP